MRRPPSSDSPATHDPASDLHIDAGGTGEIEVLPWPLLWRERMLRRVEDSDRHPWIVLATVLLGLFAVGFTITVLAVSLEEIAGDVGTSQATITWVITGPLLAAAVFGPTWGKLSDIHGARRMYLLGMSGAAIFAGLTALATTAPTLITFRVLAAAAGAAAGPASMALINTSFDRQRRVQAMGYWALVAAGGPVVGVVAGGPIVEQFGWEWIFIAQAPLTALCVLVAFAVLPETLHRPDVRMDVPGAVLIAAAAAAALLALNRGPVDGWSSPVVVGGFLLSPLLLWLWVRVERRAEAPLFPLAYLGRRNFSFPIANQFCTNFAYMGGFIITPALLRSPIFGLTISESGFVSIVRPLVFAIAGPLAGWWAVRSGERSMGIAGSFLIVTSMLTFGAVGPESTLALVIVALALSGVGMGATSPAMAASVANAVHDRDLGIAGAAQQMVATLGTVAGTQVLFTVQQSLAPPEGLRAVDPSRYLSEVATSFRWAYLVGAGVAAVAVAMAWFVQSSARATPAFRAVRDAAADAA
jgi:MFS family permease